MPRPAPNYVQEQPNGCWVWAGPKDPYGKPITSVRGKVHRVQYLYFERFYGRPAKKIACSCNTPNCVNPEHLVDAWKEKENKAKMLTLQEIEEKLQQLELIIDNLEGSPDQLLFVKQKEVLLKEKERYGQTNTGSTADGDAGSVQSNPQV